MSLYTIKQQLSSDCLTIFKNDFKRIGDWAGHTVQWIGKGSSRLFLQQNKNTAVAVIVMTMVIAIVSVAVYILFNRHHLKQPKKNDKKREWVLTNYLLHGGAANARALEQWILEGT